MTRNIAELARRQLLINQECYIAQWIIQNPDERIEDWVMCYIPSWKNNLEPMEFFMRRKTLQQ